MSNFLHDDGANKFSATLAFRNRNNNNNTGDTNKKQLQNPMDASQPHHRLLNNAARLPALQRTNSLPPGSSILGNLNIQPPLNSRLKSPNGESSNLTRPGNANTTPGKRLSALDILKNSRSQSLVSPVNSISNVMSMKNVVVPPPHKASNSNSAIIDLSSDDNEDDDDDDDDDMLSNYQPKLKYSQSNKPTIPLSSIETPTPKPIPSSEKNRIQQQSEPKSNLFNSFNKFSYNNSDKSEANSDSDDDDDDDIIITGVNIANPSNANPITPFNQSNQTHGLPSKRAVSSSMRPELIEDANYNESEMARKRQQILENKKREVEQNFLREQQIQKSMEDRLKSEEARVEKLRIDKLLEKYRPLRKLPEKYQIKFPEAQNFTIELEPRLPDSLSALEIRQDMLANLPTELKALEFRQENRNSMHSVIHRINQFADLHSRMDLFLKQSSIMRSEVHKKAILTKGNIKADIRYNQILRFFDHRIKNISKLYGEVGMQVDTLRDMKKEILQRAKSCELLRQHVLFHGFANKSLVARDFQDTSQEVKLIIGAIHEMFKLSIADGNSEHLTHTIRYFLSKPAPLPMIAIPQMVHQSPILPAPTHIVDDRSFDAGENSDDDYDDEILMSETPFGMQPDTMSNFGMNRLNPYGGGDLNDSEGIKNLMESIKVTEFEEEGLATTPDDLCISLLKHQRIGLSWMLKIEEGKSRGGILADDMGLGKTVQAISLMVAHKSDDPTRSINLIVGPVTLLRQWQQEIRMKVKTDKQMSTYLFHSTNKLRTFKEFKKYDIILVSYQTLASEWKKHYEAEIKLANKSNDAIRRNVIANRKYTSPFYSDDSVFYRIILDEAQYIKNRNTIMSKSVASLSSTYKWCLSGTPIQNRIDELFPIIRFLDIKPYNVWSKFNMQIVRSIKNNMKGGTQKVHALLSAILLRRTKDSEIDGKPILSLPEKHIVEEKVVMGKEETEFYKNLEQNSAAAANKLLRSSSSLKAYSSILTLLLRMRQMCDHQYLVKIGDEGDRVSRLDRFSKGWQAIKDYDDTVYNRINTQREQGFVCMHCTEDLATEETLLLSKCGHPICYDCHVEYFQEHVESEMHNDASARCTQCATINLRSMSVDLRLFESYVNGLTWVQVRRAFDLDSKASNKNWRLEAIRKLVEEDGKLFVSAKITKSLEIIENVMKTNPGEKIIVFSQFLGFFDILSMKLRERNIQFLQYDGSMDISMKNDTVNEFYKNPEKTVLLLSLKAGNVGLTLTCANHVIITEPFWNPYVEKQAQDRVHRISQTKEVNIHRLLIAGTVEDRIMTLQKEKEELVESALDPTARSKIVKLSRRELGFLFGLNGLATLEDD